MTLPKLACICCTYARPKLLPHLIECFLRQDYPADRCELIILDDNGQYVSQSHSEPKTWHLVSSNRRFRTLGEKRNASAALVSPDVDALLPWDDDDIYLPHALKATAAALERADWSMPSVALVERSRTRPLSRCKTRGLFHASWGFTCEVFKQANGYPWAQSGQDVRLKRRLIENKVTTFDPLSLGFDPFFIYRWGSSGSWHLSALHHQKGYDRLKKFKYSGQRIETIEPTWPLDYTQAQSGKVTPVMP